MCSHQVFDLVRVLSKAQTRILHLVRVRELNSNLMPQKLFFLRGEFSLFSYFIWLLARLKVFHIEEKTEDAS